MLNEGLEIIATQAFCNSLIESITMPSTVKEINDDAFKDCKNLKTVKLNEGLKKLEIKCFLILQ